MRAKFFLKGMGIGVTVTALIFTIAFALNPPTMSDEEIIARAKMLGMVESEEMDKGSADSDSAEETSEETSEASDETGATDETASKEAGTDEAASDAAEGESADASDAENDAAVADSSDGSEVSEEDALKALKEIQDNEAAAGSEDVNASYKTTDTVNDSSRKNGATPGDAVTFTVNQGEDSSTVAARLHRAGVIDDPTDFDLFLSENGFDTRIRPGSYNIPKGASYESIANAIAH